MPSFDIVSHADMQEVQNALDHLRREIGTRYDFKGSKSSAELLESTIVLVADEKLRLHAMQEILKQKLAKRGVSLGLVEFKDAKEAGGDTLRQEVLVKQGLNQDELKTINKSIKDLKLKVTSQIQGDQLRVSGKKKDDLQTAIAALKAQHNKLALQFVNFRD